MESAMEKPIWEDESVAKYLNSLDETGLGHLIDALKSNFSGAIEQHFSLTREQAQVVRNSSSAAHQKFTNSLDEFHKMKNADPELTISFSGLALPNCSGNSSIEEGAITSVSSSKKHRVFIAKVPGGGYPHPAPSPSPSPSPTPTPTPGPHRSEEER
jgi:hypothetical protein